MRRAGAVGAAGAAEWYLAVAGQCTSGLLDGRFALADGGPPTPDTAALADGFAHGRAGVAQFLLAYHRVGGDQSSGRGAEAMITALAAAVPDHVAAAARPGATRRYGSWCRGLAGVGSVLCQAYREYGDEGLLDLAAEAARGCLALAPRMGQAIQCCGLAGIGELMLDLVAAGRGEEFRAGAERVAALTLARSGGGRGHRCFRTARWEGSRGAGLRERRVRCRSCAGCAGVGVQLTPACLRAGC